MTPAHLMMHLKEIGYAVNVTADKTELTPILRGAIMPQITLETLNRHRQELIDFLTACRGCGRDCGCHEDRERLRGIQPFCGEASCPFRGT